MSAIILPDVVPPATWDCECLRKALEGNDRKAVIRILGHRSASQRKLIRETYEKLYKESLIDNLQKLPGDFGKAVVWWAHEPSEKDAKLANEALKARRVGPKQLQVIVEIACGSSPSHLQEVRKAYCSLFESSLEEALTSVVSNLPLRKVLLSLVRSFRHNKEVVDTNLAEEEAKKLHKAIKRKQLDDDDFVLVLSIRSVHQLRATFQSYKQNFGSSIDQDLKNCGKGDLETLLRAAVLCIGSPTTHFSEVIGGAIIGLGTDEDMLTRAILARAEIDMANMREEYLRIFKHTMDEAIIGDTSGDYMDFLMTLTGAGI